MTGSDGRRAVYAASFDPPTNGHIYVIDWSRRLFDWVVVAVGVNPAKTPTLTAEERTGLLRECLVGREGVDVDSFEAEYLVDYARRAGATHIVRGIRNAKDFEDESVMAWFNQRICPGIDTVWAPPHPELSAISSSAVNHLVGPKGWEGQVRKYVPEPVYRMFVERMGGKA